MRRLSQHPESLTIGSLKAGTIMCADDLALLSASPFGMQSLVNEAEIDASRERYLISETKTKSVTIKPKAFAGKLDPGVMLNNAKVENTSEETHLGIQRSSNCSNAPTLNARIQTARRTSYALMGQASMAYMALGLRLEDASGQPIYSHG